MQTNIRQFTKKAFKLAKQNVDKYPHKYAPKKFTQYQLLVLILLRMKLRCTYRELIDWVTEMDGIQDLLGLDKMPHYTTVQKAKQRFGSTLFRVLLGSTLNRISLNQFGAMDATGYDRSRASHHYARRTGMNIKALKTTILVDLKNFAVLDVHMTTTRKHDTRIGFWITDRNQHRLEMLAGDKGYDDRAYRNRLRDQNIRPLIRHREFQPYQKAANERMDEDQYNQRWMVETTFSILKRKYSDRIRARKWYTQFQEMLLTLVAHNLDRLIKNFVRFISRSRMSKIRSHAP